jgi:hypothetical protein
MMPIELLSVAVGVVCVVLIAVISWRGPRDPGGRLPGNDGPMVPYGDDDGGDGDG